MSQAPSTFGTITTSSTSPISVTNVTRSSSTQGDSSAFTRVHNGVPPRSAVLPTSTNPARAASFLSAATASSRLPSRTSAVRAISGTLARIFSFDGSKKWIIREGVTGISRTGSGAPMASGAKYERGLRIRGIMPSHEPSRYRWTDARGLRRAPVRPLPRGVRGRRGLQALAGQDGHRGGRSPVLPADHEPPPAAHQRRLRGAVPAGQERRRRALRLLARARHERVRHLGQGDREPRHGGAQPSGAGLPRRHAVRRDGSPGNQAFPVEAGP